MITTGCKEFPFQRLSNMWKVLSAKCEDRGHPGQATVISTLYIVHVQTRIMYKTNICFKALKI